MQSLSCCTVTSKSLSVSICLGTISSSSEKRTDVFKQLAKFWVTAIGHSIGKENMKIT